MMPAEHTTNICGIRIRPQKVKGLQFTVDPRGLDNISSEQVVDAVEPLGNRKATRLDGINAECGIEEAFLPLKLLRIFHHVLETRKNA